MGAIPTSDMPGHVRLHERVQNALDHCQETRSIDFKESQPWEALKWRIIKTSLAMGNLRDGGIIVIGASERNESWDLTGISTDHLETYDVDVLIDVINSYVSPYVDIDIVTFEYRNGEQFLAFQVREFKDSPLVCKKKSTDDESLVEGGVYIRPPGMARTTRVLNATQMHDLLELAAEKRARRMLEVSKRIGMVPGTSSEELFDDELEDI